MPFFYRHEGTRLAKAPTLRRMMPFLMPTRNEAVVYFEQQVEVARARGPRAAWRGESSDSAVPCCARYAVVEYLRRSATPTATEADSMERD